MASFLANTFGLLVYLPVILCLWLSVSTASAQMEWGVSYDEKTALSISQGALGKLLGDYQLELSDNTRLSTRELQGKPVVFSLIYTSCYHICPTTTKHLASVVEKARKVLGEDSFRVVTLGFDHFNDTPDAMRFFAARQKIDDPNWFFASVDGETVKGLSEDLGFIFFPSPNGFDHLIQATIVDKNGRVYHHVYEMKFDTPLLIEPLKNLVFQTEDSEPLFTRLTNKVRLFCTVYDPIKDQYRVDYSIFIGMLIGLTTMMSILYFVIRQWRSQKSINEEGGQ